MNPVAQLLARIIIPMVTSRATRESGRSMEEADIRKLEKEVAVAIEGNSELKNATNQESPIQSRVVWGAVIAALGVIVPMVGRVFGFEIAEEQVTEIVGTIVTLFGAAYVLYGRLASFTAPLFERRKM